MSLEPAQSQPFPAELGELRWAAGGARTGEVGVEGLVPSVLLPPPRKWSRDPGELEPSALALPGRMESNAAPLQTWARAGRPLALLGGWVGPGSLPGQR